MGDVGDYWRDVKDYQQKESRKRKRGNFVRSVMRLDERGIKYEIKDGIHFIITHEGEKYDFWPTTGKFYVRSKKKYGRGVFNLLKVLEGEK